MIIVFFFPSTAQINDQAMNYTVVVLRGYMSLSVFFLLPSIRRCALIQRTCI
ncbi:hypothetical protein BDR03DRAFT_700047 [Suillus americanus]|nr:hypothetical protein BDR03DRAFT_700047 [Suillus americanus]